MSESHATDLRKLGEERIVARFGSFDRHAVTLPPTLAGVLAEGKAALHAHSEHELILPLRKKIWRALGPAIVDRRNRALRTPGLERRTMLAVCATTLVLPLWEQQFATRDPHHMLNVVDQYLRGEIDWNTAREEWYSFIDGLRNDDRNTLGERWHCIYVGRAALGVLSVALDDQDLDDDGTLDEHLEDWDPSLYACGAFSGELSLPWAGGRSDPAKRREFWEWYLDEAVPRAFAQGRKTTHTPA